MKKHASVFKGRVSMAKTYSLPSVLEGKCDEGAYLKWLTNKKNAHARRKNLQCRLGNAKLAIHRAVEDHDGRDPYTGRPLRWDLINTYRNEESKREGRDYRRKNADLPTVDHIVLNSCTIESTRNSNPVNLWATFEAGRIQNP